MTAPISSVGAPIAPPSLDPAGPLGAARTAGAPDLATSFADALSEARSLDTQATQAAEGFAAGDPKVGIHEVMIATAKADVELRYATTFTNKAVEAYRDLMNTQV